MPSVASDQYTRVSESLALLEATRIRAGTASGRTFSDEAALKLSLSTRDWMAACHFLGFSAEGVKHGDPIVAGVAGLQADQIASSHENIPERIRRLLESIVAASPERLATVGASALLSIARVSLRAGAWQLLEQVLPPGLALARLHPFRRRLSVATGLAAEWALCSGNPRIACVYANESLQHGSEFQRIQGYLGLAHALASKWDHAVLFFEAARAVQFAQHPTRDRLAFGQMHLIKCDALRAIADGEARYLESARQKYTSAIPLFETAKSSIPRLLSKLALNLAQQELALNPAFEFSSLHQELVVLGRWRDAILLERLLGYPKLPPENQSVRNNLETMASNISLPPASIIDRQLDQLCETNGSTPIRSGKNLPTVLFCV